MYIICQFCHYRQYLYRYYRKHIRYLCDDKQIIQCFSFYILNALSTRELQKLEIRIFVYIQNELEAQTQTRW